jgi:Anti-sigma factor NepR
MRRQPDERFSQWLDQKLRRLYERELSEPIPDDMLRLLRMIESGGK